MSPRINVGGSWAPLGIVPVNSLGSPLINTVILLRSRSPALFRVRYRRSNTGGPNNEYLVPFLDKVRVVYSFTIWLDDMCSNIYNNGQYDDPKYLLGGFRHLNMLMKQALFLHHKLTGEPYQRSGISSSAENYEQILLIYSLVVEP